MADVRLTIDEFPEDLKRRLKACAALEGIPMRYACIDAIEDWCLAREAQMRVQSEAAGQRQAHRKRA